MSSACPSSTLYPMASSRLPWSPSPKRNQLQECRSAEYYHDDRPSRASFDYQSPQAPSSRNLALMGNHYIQTELHTSPGSSSLLKRIQFPPEERSLLDRMDFNEETKLNISDSLQNQNKRICGLQHTNSSLESPNSAGTTSSQIGPSSRGKTRQTAMIPLNLPSQTPTAEVSSSVETAGFEMLCEPPPGSAAVHCVGSPSIIERCRQHLAPIILMSAKSQNSETNLDIEQCGNMLTDLHCHEFLQQARDMKLQMDVLAPNLPDNLRVIKVDEHNNDHRDQPLWTTRDRSLVDDIAPRKDSEATLVDSSMDHKVSTSVELSRQKSANGGIAFSVQKIMGHDEALSLQDHNSADLEVAVAAPIDAQSPLMAIIVNDIETTTSPTCHSSTDQNIAISHTSSSLPTTLPILSTPGTWLTRQGLTRPGILDIDFMVEERVAPASPSISIFNPPSIVQLSCFHEDPGHRLREGDKLDATLDKIRNAGEDWPAAGSVVVQLNVEHPNGRSWLPYQLAKGPLNMTSSIVQGKNTMRLIQLSDVSDCTFVLYALPSVNLKRERPWMERGWASKITRLDISSSTTSSILKYANIPVALS